DCLPPPDSGSPEARRRSASPVSAAIWKFVGCASRPHLSNESQRVSDERTREPNGACPGDTSPSDTNRPGSRDGPRYADITPVHHSSACPDRALAGQNFLKNRLPGSGGRCPETEPEMAPSPPESWRRRQNGEAASAGRAPSRGTHILPCGIRRSHGGP